MAGIKFDPIVVSLMREDELPHEERVIHVEIPKPRGRYPETFEDEYDNLEADTSAKPSIPKRKRGRPKAKKLSGGMRPPYKYPKEVRKPKFIPRSLPRPAVEVLGQRDSSQLYADMVLRLRQARQRAMISQEDIARAIGVSRASVAAWEAGATQISSFRLIQMLKVYNADPAWVVFGVDSTLKMIEFLVERGIIRIAQEKGAAVDDTLSVDASQLPTAPGRVRAE